MKPASHGAAPLEAGRVLPSGRQVEIRHGDLAAVVTEVGAGLRTLSKGSWEILDGYPPDRLCQAGRGQLLLPWPNRLRDGRYQLAGQTRQLALTEPEKGHAIHGLTRYASWALLESGASSCQLGYLLHPEPGYDFTLQLSVEYRLADDGLRVRVSARNLGIAPAPYAAGAHPYLRLDDRGVDGWLLRAPARVTMAEDERDIPTGRLLPVAGTDHDFTTQRLIGDSRLDTCFTELERGPDGLAWVDLETSEHDRKVSLWLNRDHPYLMLFTGDSLAPDERRRSLGVEPMTAAPNAFQNGLGLRLIDPGETVTTEWGISPRE